MTILRVIGQTVCLLTRPFARAGTYLVVKVYGLFNVVCKVLFVYPVYIVRIIGRLDCAYSDCPEPPGPWGLPIVGHTVFMNSDFPFLTYMKWARQYGSIYRVRMGGIPTVVVSDAAIIKQAFSKSQCSGKPPLHITNGVFNGYGIVCTEGPLWKEQRQFTRSCLRDFGISQMKLLREKLTERIQEEVFVLLNNFEAESALAFDPHMSLRMMVAKNISKILFGKHFDEGDREFNLQLDELDRGSELVHISLLLNFFPLLRFIPPHNKKVDLIKNNIKGHHAFLSVYINKHKDSGRPNLDKDHKSDDFTEAYLIQMEKMAAEYRLTKKKHYFTDTQFLYLLADLLGAGTETLRNTTKYGLLYLANHPHCQRKLQKELDNFVGSRSDINLQKLDFDEIKNLPYLQAVIWEVQRMADVAPVGVPHSSVTSVKLGPYYVPKGAMIIPLLAYINRDPQLWVNPDAFMPERFLTKGIAVKPSFFIPFSVGQRVCVGEELAKMTLFYTFFNIFLKFNVEWPSRDPPDYTPKPAFLNGPKPYKIRVTLRSPRNSPEPGFSGSQPQQPEVEHVD